MERKVKHVVKGSPDKDGAGVKLIRVLDRETVDKYDPFLLLDSFDSRNPDDYIAGFPMHPHRGIETITFLSNGSIRHKDSLDNIGIVSDGEVQWMTAGSGILHEEMLLESEYMLGIQLWVNLPAKNKMTDPEYHEITKDKIPEIPIENGKLRIIGGEYNGVYGHRGNYLPVTFYDIHLEKNSSFFIPAEKDESAFVFLLKGNGKVSGVYVEEKTAVMTTEGDKLFIESMEDDIEILFISAPRLNEEVAWGGPIVMNTMEELRLASKELREGTFIKLK